jgi:hypothetical protein
VGSETIVKSTSVKTTSVKTCVWPTAPEDIRHYRALGSICRQQAVLHPEASWTWLSQAEKWESLAEAALPAVAASVPIAPALAEREAA